MSTVSIVLPTYNGARYIREAIASCLSQSYRDIELTIVNDGSSDETPAILKEVNDPRVKKICHSVNQGLVCSLNNGFAHSSGQFLTWTSDDNRFAPTAIEEMVSFLLEHADIAFVYADYWNIDEEGNITERVYLPSPSFLPEFNCINACFLYHRIVYEVVGEYDSAAAPAEDYDYWLRVYRQFRMARLPKPLYYYRKHRASLSSQYGPIRQQEAAERARMKWIGPAPYRFPSRLARNLARIYLDWAFEAHRGKDWAARRKYLLQALRYDPRHLTNRGVRSLLVRSLARFLTGTEK